MISYPNVKLNLGLNVLRKRPDGFHDLETLFIPCNAFHDVLEITEAGSFGIEICGPSFDWDPMQDLTARAYGLLAEDFGIPPVHIRLEKLSPVGAGLGGGSADAAFTLRMLDELFSLHLPDEALASYAARLGSDCAFFIYNRPMIGEGRGEMLSPWDIDLGGYEIRVEIPEGVAVSTAEAYRGVLASRNADAAPLRESLSRPVPEWRDCLTNDFENTIFPLHPQIAALKRSMYDRGAVYAAMSGSGSAVFGIFAE